MCDRAVHTMSLLQASYIDSILTHFALTDEKPYSNPMVPGLIYSVKHSPSNPEQVMCMQKTPYWEVIGSLMYAAIATCLYIAFTVSTLSQFLSNPGIAHCEAVK